MKRDLTNKKFGKLIVIKFLEKRGNNSYWLCQCECGTFRQVAGNALTRTKYSTISCGCSKVIRMEKLNRLPGNLGAQRRILQFYIKGAKARKLEFTLSFDKFCKLTQQCCHYCGIKPNNSTKTINPHGATQIMYNGIDRIDNTKGYILDNVVSCCSNCNYAKFDLSYDAFKIYLERLGAHYVKTHPNMRNK